MSNSLHRPLLTPRATRQRCLCNENWLLEVRKSYLTLVKFDFGSPHMQWEDRLVQLHVVDWKDKHNYSNQFWIPAKDSTLGMFAKNICATFCNQQKSATNANNNEKKGKFMKFSTK